MSDSFTEVVYSLAACGDTIFAACTSGLYRSTDGGQTWTSAYDTLSASQPADTPLATSAVAVSPDFAHDRTVYAAVGGTILRSEDAGAHWTATVLGGPQGVAALGISRNYSQDGVALAATVEHGVFCTSDRGARWAACNFGLLDLATLCIAVSPGYADDETLFVGTESGLFRSTNGSRAWREVDLPVGYCPVLSLALSPAFAYDGVVFAGTEIGDLLTSSDGAIPGGSSVLRPIKHPLTRLSWPPTMPLSPTLCCTLAVTCCFPQITAKRGDPIL